MQKNEEQNGKCYFVWVARLGGVFFVVAAIGVFLVWNYGSVQNAIHSVGGKVVRLEPETLDLGTITAEEITAEFRCINVSNKPIELLGGASDCPCVILDRFPKTIPAYGELRMRVGIHVTDTMTDFSHKFILYTEANREVAVVGCIVGKVDLKSLNDTFESSP